MTEREFAEALEDYLLTEDAWVAAGPMRVRSFQEAGVMTLNQGLVVTSDDGSEFQVTIVRSRGPKAGR